MPKKIITAVFVAFWIIPSVTFASGLKNPNEKTEFIDKENFRDNPREKTPKNAGSADNNYCDGLYDGIMSKVGKDLKACVQDLDYSSDCVLPDGAKTPYSKINVAIILDSSGSMGGTVSGRKKSEVAKKAIIDFVSSLPKEINVSLIVFGHKGSDSAEGRALSCSGVETLYPLSPLNAEDFISKAGSFSPFGMTPLALAIKKAEAVLQAGGTGNKNIIYVVSDGLETCGGDPAGIAREVNTSATKVEVNIIGFTVNNVEQAKLKEAAESGGGKFYLANNSAELNKTFRDNEMYLRRYLMCSNIAMGKLAIESGSVSGKTNICFSVGVSSELMNFGVEERKLSGDDSARCHVRLAERLAERHRVVHEMQDALNNKNQASFNKALQELKSGIREAETSPGKKISTHVVSSASTASKRKPDA